MTEVTMAHKAASYQIGDPDAAMIAVPHGTCVICGGEVVPLLGKVMQGTSINYGVWIEGNYEHVERPATPHPALSVGEAKRGAEIHAAAQAHYAEKYAAAPA